MDDNLFQDLIESIKCPICCLAMVPPLRSPMIIPECGHTACESCISKVHECPFCKQEFNKAISNITLLGIVDNLIQKNLIPQDINPPPPFENKLLPKIEPLCTYLATGKHYIAQKSYECKTCGVTGHYGVCEVCVNRCHKGHETNLDQNWTSSNFFCDCPDFNCCKCTTPDPKKLKCSFDITYGCSINQPMYQCLDCEIIDDSYICQSCAINCHHEHNLRYCGMVNGKTCQCLTLSNCLISMRRPICTYLFTGKKSMRQAWYHCRTCGLVGSQGCCASCAHHCHKNHDVYLEGIKDEASCSCIRCGLGECKLLDIPNSSYLTRCSNLFINNKYLPKTQRMYHCLSCGLTDDAYGICEACAVNCHINHVIEFVGMKTFSCACKNMGCCAMSVAQLLHNRREKCDRKVLGKDDVSACYTCYTCDKSGDLRLCETCALKKHLEHDIHLVGYMKFECADSKDEPVIEEEEEDKSEDHKE